MPVLALNASRTFWKASCSLPPQSDMTVILLPAAADPLGAAPVGVWLQAATTNSRTKARIARGRGNRAMENLPSAWPRARPSKAARVYCGHPPREARPAATTDQTAGPED